MSVAISGYAGAAMFLSHYLYTSYVKKDPEFSGKLSVGFGLGGNWEVNYKYGYYSSILIGVATFFIMAGVLMLLPATEELTIAGLIRSYVWVLIPAFALVFISHFSGASISKLGLNVMTIAMIYLCTYASIESADLKFMIQCILAGGAALAAVGVAWHVFYQEPRLKIYAEREGFRAVFYGPATYFWSSFALILGVGSVLALCIYGFTHP